MKKLMLSAALALLPFPALAADATVTISVTAQGNTITETRTVPLPHLARMIAVYRVHFGAQLTDEEVLRRWATEFFRQTRNVVRQEEQRAAEIAAGNAVAPIDSLDPPE